MVPFSLRYDGALRCTLTHDNSGTSITTDAPTDNFGTGSTFSPTDLAASSLAACMITTIGIKLRGSNVPLEGTRAEIEKHMSTGLPRRIARIVVRLTFPAGIAETDQQRIREIGDSCPVALSLHPDIVQDVQYIFPAP